MSIDEAIQAKLDAQTSLLRQDHLRELTVALHKVQLAEQLAQHLGLPPITNPAIEELKGQLPALTQQLQNDAQVQAQNQAQVQQ